ncbi:PREDICTED: uncharacterized protein LOC105314890, partial [Amphimedon queenslandica]|uniref:Uncharacterized protein n=2 Tax=Amphimedon queenslandica TaxID=400682 RepID=A0AAN0JSA4_AMPQE
MNVWRVMNKRKKQEKRKHASVSSVPDSFSVPSASGSSVSSSQSSTGLHTGGITTGGATGLYHHNAPNSTSLKVQEPPAHHIVHVQTPPRRDSGHSPSHHPNQEVWASKVNGSAPSFTLGTLSPNPHLPKVESNIRILLEDKCSSAEPEDEEIDGVEEGEEEYEEKLKEDKPGDAEDPEVIEVEEEDQVGEKLRQLIEIVEVCLTSNQGMQSTELTRASLNLLKTYK